MKRIVEGIALALILVMTNVVAAGVTLTLGPLVTFTEEAGMTEVAGLSIILALAVFCAVCFLEGAVLQAKRFIERHQP